MLLYDERGLQIYEKCALFRGPRMTDHPICHLTDSTLSASFALKDHDRRA